MLFSKKKKKKKKLNIMFPVQYIAQVELYSLLNTLDCLNPKLIWQLPRVAIHVGAVNHVNKIYLNTL